MDFFSKLKLWQVFIALAVVSCSAALTGFGMLSDNYILDDKEDVALVLGMVCLGCALLLKYHPPPNQ